MSWFGRPACRTTTRPPAVSPGCSPRALKLCSHEASRTSWVGKESNLRDGGLRVRCKASVCYQPLVVSRGDRLSEPAWALACTSADSHEQVTGIEPAGTGVAHPSVTVNHLQTRPTLWNRTRTSRFSAERADLSTPERDVASVRVGRNARMCVGACQHPHRHHSSIVRDPLEDTPRASRTRSGVWNSGSRIAELGQIVVTRPRKR